MTYFNSPEVLREWFKNKKSTVITTPHRGVNPKTKVQELKQNTSYKANPQVTTPIQRSMISSNISKYKATPMLREEVDDN